MNTQVEIIERAEEHTIGKRVDCSVMKMPAEIKNAYLEIMDFVKESSGETSGMPFVKYIDVNWQGLMEESKLKAFFRAFTRTWHMVIGFPVKEKIEGNGNLVSGIFEGGKYIKTIHLGPYQKVTPAYKRIVAYAESKNLEMKDESIEIYTNDPRETPKEELETIILVPLKKNNA
jgi:effector-binding domain-containing protein